jgi:hypothetical protein
VKYGAGLNGSMAKQTKKAKRPPATPGPATRGLPAELVSPEHFKRARDLLRGRADALILDLAKSYLVSKAEELTTVLDAMDSLAEFERLRRLAPAS